MTDAPTEQDISQILQNVHLAEAMSRAALQEVWDTRSRLRRMEASLALVLGTLTSLSDQGSGFVLQRLSQELRRFADLPEEAARLANCDDRDVDPVLLQTIAAHLCDLGAGEGWQAPPPKYAVMH